MWDLYVPLIPCSFFFYSCILVSDSLYFSFVSLLSHFLFSLHWCNSPQRLLISLCMSTVHASVHNLIPFSHIFLLYCCTDISILAILKEKKALKAVINIQILYKCISCLYFFFVTTRMWVTSTTNSNKTLWATTGNLISRSHW